MRVTSLAALALVATGAHASDAPVVADEPGWVFRCDGTDEELLKEIDEAFRTRVGYGETWDETLCNQGVVVLGEGARTPTRSPKTTAAPAAPGPTATTTPRKLSALEQRMQDQFFALAIPAMGVAAALFSVAVASLIGLFLRLKKQIVVDVGCPSCRTVIPFVVGESPQLFCPACGGACRVDLHRDGKRTSATAVPL